MLHQIDDIVWKIATTIYVESGYKVDFSLIHNIATSRIKTLENSIADQKAEEAKLRAEMQTQNLSDTNSNQKDKEKEYFLNCIGDLNMYQVFIEIKAILANILEVEPSAISLDSHIVNDLGADDLDIAELAIELESKFDIKILDGSSARVKRARVKSNYFHSDYSLSPISSDVLKIVNYIGQQTSLANKTKQ